MWATISGTRITGVSAQPGQDKVEIDDATAALFMTDPRAMRTFSYDKLTSKFSRISPLVVCPGLVKWCYSEDEPSLLRGSWMALACLHAHEGSTQLMVVINSLYAQSSALKIWATVAQDRHTWVASFPFVTGLYPCPSGELDFWSLSSGSPSLVHLIRNPELLRCL